MADNVVVNKVAEYGVVASLCASHQWFGVARHLEPGHFIRSDARKVFTEMKAMYADNRPWALVDFMDFYLQYQEYEAMSSVQFEARVRQVEEAHVCNVGLNIAKKLGAAAMQEDVAAVEAALAEAHLPTRGGDDQTAAEVAVNLFDHIGKRGESQLPTGLHALDSGGLLVRQSETILAARPSMGKSQLAAQIADHNASIGNVVAYWSGEMSNEKVTNRMVQARCGVSVYDARDQMAVSAVSHALSDLSRMDTLHLFDEKMTSIDFWGQCRRVADRHGRLDLIVVDHVRLFSDTHQAERHRLGQIVSNLKYMAKEFDAAVLSAAQLSRATEGREDKHPTLTDLRDSGEIEEDTDIAAFIYREGYYSRDKVTGTQSGPAQVYLMKNRDGDLFGANLYFDNEGTARFLDVRPR